MELRFSGKFYKDIDINNRKVLDAVRDTISNVENAGNISQINNLKKLEKYKIHYRIRVADDYRIGIIIRGNVVRFVRFGHRNIFYKKLFFR
ncbi:MAG: hypothetical protein ACLQQ4_14835 [Bacteroidia bacterium]